MRKLSQYQIIQRAYTTRKLLGVTLWTALVLPALCALHSIAALYGALGIMLALAGGLWWYRQHLLNQLK